MLQRRGGKKIKIKGLVSSARQGWVTLIVGVVVPKEPPSCLERRTSIVLPPLSSTNVCGGDAEPLTGWGGRRRRVLIPWRS